MPQTSLIRPSTNRRKEIETGTQNIHPGLYYHVLNRSAGRIALFRHEKDYAAFERIMIEAAQRFPLRIVDW